MCILSKFSILLQLKHSIYIESKFYSKQRWNQVLIRSRKVELSMKLLQAIPALPVKDLAKSIHFYVDALGLELAHRDIDFAICRRDSVEIHLWVASDDSWLDRIGKAPVVSGAESFIAGTASCRLQVDGVDDLYRQLEPLGIVHPNGKISDQPWGDRDFSVLDPDNNLIAFFERLGTQKGT
jgi:catechol 2,3-dioxygenase-like lactoylglutathione lyase family enzyme